MLTGDDLFPTLDESLLLGNPVNLDLGLKDTDALNWTSQSFSDPVSTLSIERGRNAPAERPDFYDDDLGLDVDPAEEPSIEQGRDGPPTRPVVDDLIEDGDKLYADDGLDFNLGHEEEPMAEGHGNEPAMDIDNPDNFNFDVNETSLGFPNAEDAARPDHNEQSPLSSARSSLARDLDATGITEESSEHIAVQRTAAAKKRKVLQLDSETTLHRTQIENQQKDRSGILKPISFLPKDPVLLSLMQMQKSGGFVSSIMGDGRSKGWAPELRGILSIEVIRKSGELKRKRDIGVANVEEDNQQIEEDMPQLEIPEEDDVFGGLEIGIETGGEDGKTADRDTSIINIPRLPTEEPGDNGMDLAIDAFDDTTAPLIHPIDQGPVSQGTKHAVHLLRDRFGASADANSTPSQQTKANVLFQDLLPERTTSKADATKMFFEVLVLATKDAVKVEQKEGEIGGPIRVRAKRGLWGDWAEREAGGEIDKEGSSAIEVS